MSPTCYVHGLISERDSFRYYNYRDQGDTPSDPRLDIFKRVRTDLLIRATSSVSFAVPDISVAQEWFQGKRCLDIGSNSGQFTLSVAKRFKVRSAHTDTSNHGCLAPLGRFGR